MSIAGNKTRRTQALLAAEAGLARADYVLASSPGVTNAANLLTAINADTALPNASFRVAMDSTLPRRRVISLGRAGDGQSAVQVLYEHGPNRRNIWNNAIFVGSGADGRPVLGSVVAHGPVHLVGGGEPFQDANANGVWDAGEPFADTNHDGTYDPPVASDSVAWDLSGVSCLLGHATGMPAKLSPRMPSAEFLLFGGENVQTLHTELRVAHGQVRLEAGDQVGQPNAPAGSPACKETIDGVYVEDGFCGSPTSGSVHSDNGCANGYDLDTPPAMPNLDAPYTDGYGVEYASYMEYLRSHALVIAGDLELRNGMPMALQSSGFGALAVNSVGLVQGSGIIYVEGNIRVTRFGDVQYDGRFTLACEGDVEIADDLLPKDEFVSQDVLGIISHGQIVLGTTPDQPEVAAALFAQERIFVQNQYTFIAGAAVANQWRADQPTHVYFVPGLAAAMPPGMPGTAGQEARTWRQVPRSWVELE